MLKSTQIVFSNDTNNCFWLSSVESCLGHLLLNKLNQNVGKLQTVFPWCWRQLFIFKFFAFHICDFTLKSASLLGSYVGFDCGEMLLASRESLWSLHFGDNSVAKPSPWQELANRHVMPWRLSYLSDLEQFFICRRAGVLKLENSHMFLFYVFLKHMSSAPGSLERYLLKQYIQRTT